MVKLEDDAVVFYSGTECKVLKGGDFEDQDLVEVYVASDPDKKAMYALQAYLILNGKNLCDE